MGFAGFKSDAPVLSDGKCDGWMDGSEVDADGVFLKSTGPARVCVWDNRHRRRSGRADGEGEKRVIWIL